MTGALKQFGISTVIIAAAFSAVYGLSGYLDRHRVSLPETYADSDLDLQGGRLHGFALGSEGLLADWYWMRSLQYLGDKIAKSDAEILDLENLRSLNPRLLYPLLDTATDLDPHFIMAYSYGAVVLPAIDPQQAIKLSEKGIANNPEQWRLYSYLGYIYWRLKSYDKAAEVYERGSNIDGAPAFMKMMVAAMKTQGGSRDTARVLYSQMYDEADDQSSRDNAHLRLLELDSLDERDAIAKALANFKERNGRCAVSIVEIFPYLRGAKPASGKSLNVSPSGAIVDPAGTPYVLNVRECKADLSPDSRIPKS
ncbi:MAG TPA: hypothetical protein VK468_05635 [Pyrinomonadaceae bacterium]|nr:hypothetical protein [Pyrinomonadaceae bacterium]